MTSKLTIEQAKRLRNDFECWQQDYDPKDDKEQYDMFGRGMAAMDMLIVGMYQEPVAWIVHARTGDQLTTDGSYVANAEGILGLHSTPLYRHAQQPVVPDDYQHLKNVRELYHKQEDRLFALAQRISGESFDKYSHVPSQAIDVLERTIFGDEGDACSAAMLQAGNSPVIGIDLAAGPDRTVEVRYVAPPGYVMVPKEPTETMINAWLSEVANWRGHVAGYKAMLAAAQHDTPALNSLQSVVTVSDTWIPVSERMPENGQHIIIFCDDAFVLSAQYRDGEFFDVVRDGDEFFETTSRCVTHWMPLPAAPQEVR